VGQTIAKVGKRTVGVTVLGRPQNITNDTREPSETTEKVPFLGCPGGIFKSVRSISGWIWQKVKKVAGFCENNKDSGRGRGYLQQGFLANK